MGTIINFVKGNPQIFWGLLIFLFSWILPVPRFKKFGEQVGEQLSPKLVKLISERLKAFERGLMETNVNGDINLVDNETVKNEMKKVKLGLGLKE